MQRSWSRLISIYKKRREERNTHAHTPTKSPKRQQYNMKNGSNGWKREHTLTHVLGIQIHFDVAPIWSIPLSLSVCFSLLLGIRRFNRPKILSPIPIKTLVIRIHLICIWNSVQFDSSSLRVLCFRIDLSFNEIKDQSQFRSLTHFQCELVI